MPKARSILFFLFSLAILFFDFYSDGLHAAGQYFWDDHQITLESFIIGRMVKSGRDGMFSAGGLTGLVGPDAVPPDIEHQNYRFQTQAYLNSLPFQTYSIYKSQNGVQGIMYSALNAILPFSPADKLSILHAIASLLSALVLVWISYWFYREFGAITGAVVLLSTALSQWLVVFAHSLWWSTWAFYFPMAVLMYYLARRQREAKHPLLKFGALVFAVVLVKCLFNGFEYITTALIMMTVPLAYICVREKESMRSFLTSLSTAALASFLAVLTSATVLCIQIATVEGSLLSGVNQILFSLLRRSYGNPQDFSPDYTASLTANPIDVVATYLRGIYLDLDQYFRVPSNFITNYFLQFRYLYLILIFAFAAALLIYLVRRTPDDVQRRSLALAAATGFSLLAPLSWLIIFKAHSYIHTFMNNIVWQMPFTIYGFAVCGLVLQTLLTSKRKTGEREFRRRAQSNPQDGV
jgi:hypothetical protein